MQSPVELKYEAGEKILCFHGPLLYEAKCLQTRTEGDCKYFVHYQGWKKNWDEWVNDSRIVRYDEAGLKKQKELEKYFKKGSKLKTLKKSELLNQTAPPPEAIQRLEKIDRKQDSHEIIVPEALDDTSAPEEVVHEEIEDDAAISTSSSTRAGSVQPQRRSRGRPPKNDASKIYKNPSNRLLQELPSSNATKTRGRKPSNVTSSLSREESIDKSSQQMLTRKRTLPPSFLSPSSTPTVVQHIELMKKFHLNLDYPSALRDWLIDDWDFINRRYKIHRLPARITVREVLRDYKLSDWSMQGAEEPLEDVKEEFAEGLLSYFNLLLGSQLLFKFERAQYSDFYRATTDFVPADCYGPFHLLRLFVKLRDLVPYTKVDQSALHVLKCMSNHFLHYLNHHCSTYFNATDFTSTTNDYQRRAMS